jgi:hypothetical protein
MVPSRVDHFLESPDRLGRQAGSAGQEEVMRRLGVWGVASRLGISLLGAVLVVLSTATLVAAADPACRPSVLDENEDSKTNAKQGSSWFSFGNWFGTDKKPPDTRPNTRADGSRSTEGRQAGSTEGRQAGRGKADDKNAAKKESLLEAEPSASDLAARRRALEEAALLRRQELCDRLAEVALQTNNAELANLAEQLKQRAWDVYTRRTANLPVVTQAVNYDLDPMPGRNGQRGGGVGPEGRLDGELPLQPSPVSQPLAGREEYR